MIRDADLQHWILARRDLKEPKRTAEPCKSNALDLSQQRHIF